MSDSSFKIVNKISLVDYVESYQFQETTFNKMTISKKNLLLKRKPLIGCDVLNILYKIHCIFKADDICNDILSLVQSNITSNS